MSEEVSTPIAKNEASEPLFNNNNNNAAKIRSKIVQAAKIRVLVTTTYCVHLAKRN